MSAPGTPDAMGALEAYEWRRSPMVELRTLQRALDVFAATRTKSALDDAMTMLGDACVAAFESDLADMVKATIIVTLINLRPVLERMGKLLERAS